MSLPMRRWGKDDKFHRKMDNIHEAVIKTLCYRDLFDYPLEEEELIRFLIEASANPLAVRRALAQLIAEGKVEEKNGYLLLPGRGEIAGERMRKLKIHKEKYAKAHKLAQLLKNIPWVKAVFLTGALAASNAEEDDDIDFLIITDENRVWVTRLLSYLLFIVLRAKRKPGVDKAPDMVCLNMFLSEKTLKIPKNEQNLFTAHEVALSHPLWAKDYFHLRFLGENPWVREHLPNIKLPKVKIKAQENGGIPVRFGRFLLTLFDIMVYKIQLYYMRKRRTREIVERDRILFHPIDLSHKILSAYRVKLYSIQHSSPNFSVKESSDGKKA